MHCNNPATLIRKLRMQKNSVSIDWHCYKEIAQAQICERVYERVCSMFNGSVCPQVSTNMHCHKEILCAPMYGSVHICSCLCVFVP